MSENNEQDELPPTTSRHSSQSSNVSQHSNPASSSRTPPTSGVFSVPSSASSPERSDSDHLFARVSDILDTSLKKIQDHFDKRVSGVEEKVDKLEKNMETRLEAISTGVNATFGKTPRHPTSRDSTQGSSQSTPVLQSTSGVLHYPVSETASPSLGSSQSSAGNSGDSPLLNALRGDRSKTPSSSRETYPSVSPQEEVSRSGAKSQLLFDKSPIIFEVPCICQQQLSPLPLISLDEVIFVLIAPQITSSALAGHVETYRLNDGRRCIDKDKHFINCKKNICSTVLLHSKKLTVLANDPDVHTKNLKLMLYELNSKAPIFSWDLILNSKCSTLQLELKNSVCAMVGDDDIIVTSILNQSTKQTSSRLVFHLFSPVKKSPKYWKMAYLQLYPADEQYQIQSCVVISHFLHCSVFLPGTGVTIYKIDLTPLQQHSTTSEGCLLCCQSSYILKVQNCHLSVLNKNLISIASSIANNKTTLTVNRHPDHLSSPSQICDYDFQFVMKVLTATTASIYNTLLILYHHDEMNKCYLQKITMAPN